MTCTRKLTESAILSDLPDLTAASWAGIRRHCFAVAVVLPGRQVSKGGAEGLLPHVFIDVFLFLCV